MIPNVPQLSFITMKKGIRPKVTSYVPLNMTLCKTEYKSELKKETIFTSDLSLDDIDNKFPIDDIKQILLKPIKKDQVQLIQNNICYEILSPNKYLIMNVMLGKLKDGSKTTREFIEHVNYLLINMSSNDPLIEVFAKTIMNRDIISNLNSITPSLEELSNIRNILEKYKNVNINLDLKDHVNNWISKICEVEYVKEIFNHFETLHESKTLFNDLKTWVYCLESNFQAIKESKLLKIIVKIVVKLYLISIEDEDFNACSSKSFDFSVGVKALLSYKSSKKLFKRIINYINPLLKEEDVISEQQLTSISQSIGFLSFIPKLHIEFKLIENSLFDINVLLRSNEQLRKFLDAEFFQSIEIAIREVYKILDELTFKRNAFLEYFSCEVNNDNIESFFNASTTNKQSTIQIREINWKKVNSIFETVLNFCKEANSTFNKNKFLSDKVAEIEVDKTQNEIELKELNNISQTSTMTTVNEHNSKEKEQTKSKLMEIKHKTDSSLINILLDGNKVSIKYNHSSKSYTTTESKNLIDITMKHLDNKENSLTESNEESKLNKLLKLKVKKCQISKY